MTTLGLFGAALVAGALSLSSAATPSIAAEFVSPDIFVLGDSQITFGAGPPLVELFDALPERCAAHWHTIRDPSAFDQMTVGVMGIRSTSIHALVAKDGRAKALVCEKDKKWGVNAGSYGVLREGKRRFEQVGEHAHNQFCHEGQSPLQSMFAQDYYAPKLLVLMFLGNATQRWANDPERLADDVRELTAQLPPDLPCIYATTGPTYQKKRNALRRKAQDNFARAMTKFGQRCEFVAGIADDTLTVFEGNPRYYRKKKSGEVKDPIHLNGAGARRFLGMRTEALCTAVERAMAPSHAARPARATPPRPGPSMPESRRDERRSVATPRAVFDNSGRDW